MDVRHTLTLGNDSGIFEDRGHLLFDGRKEMSPYSDDPLTVTIPFQ